MTTFPPKRILVPMDLSEPSMSALEAAKAVARRGGASLTVVYVQSPEAVGLPADPNLVVMTMPDLDRIEHDYARWCVERLRKAVAGFPPSRVRVRTLHGWPKATLAGLASRRTTDLVVVGSHGYHGFDRLLHGSVSEALVRRATAPVLAVHPRRTPFKPRRFLVPCNLEAHADAALRYALDLADLLGARVDALLVTEAGRARAEEGLRAHLRETLGARAARVGVLALSGDPREAIVSVSRRYDLVALSAHHRVFFKRWVLGSTVERVLRHSPVPVLAVPSVEGGRWQEVDISIGGVPAKGFLLPG